MGVPRISVIAASAGGPATSAPIAPRAAAPSASPSPRPPSPPSPSAGTPPAPGSSTPTRAAAPASFAMPPGAAPAAGRPTTASHHTTPLLPITLPSSIIPLNQQKVLLRERPRQFFRFSFRVLALRLQWCSFLSPDNSRITVLLEDCWSERDEDSGCPDWVKSASDCTVLSLCICERFSSAEAWQEGSYMHSNCHKSCCTVGVMTMKSKPTSSNQASSSSNGSRASRKLRRVLNE